MRHTLRGVLGTVVALVVMTMPAIGGAEDIDALRQELETMRRQLEAATRRIQELGERLRRLESRPTPPPTAAGPPAPPPVGAAPVRPPAALAAPATPPASAADTAPSLAQMLTPRQPFALAQPGRSLLFDIGVSGDFVADFTSREHERQRDGTFAGRENRLFAREISLGFFGRVDPYASAVVRITAGEETPPIGQRRSDLEVAVEEANVTLLALPLGTTARVGLMRPRFGTLNSVHQDDLPQVDRPRVLTRFFGEEQLDAESGVDAFWVLPLPVYEEISVGVFDGDNETAFGRGTLRDPLVVGRLRTFFEGDEWGALQIDVSAGTGITDDDRRNTVAGLGLKYKWAPVTGVAFPLVTLAGEAIYGHRSADRWGYYVYGQYDWTRRWAAGIRWDWTQSPTLTGHEWAISPYIQFKPSEFLRFRAQYKHTEAGGGLGGAADEVFLQGSFILGAHPTERF